MSLTLLVFCRRPVAGLAATLLLKNICWSFEICLKSVKMCEFKFRKLNSPEMVLRFKWFWEVPRHPTWGPVLTSAVNCRMPENEGPPMRFCCFAGGSVSVSEKKGIRQEAQTKCEQDIHIASNFHSTNIDFETILEFQIDNKTVQKSSWICAST